MSDSSTTATAPLTTIFAPPPSCSSAWTYEAASYNLLPFTLLLQNAVDVNTPCFPPNFSANGRAFALQVYSPGWCPHGYTSASFNGFRGTTTAVCCQSNFFYTTSTSPQADGNTLLFTGCISSYGSSTSVLSRSGSLATASASVGPGTLWGQPITVMNEASDLSLYSTTSTAMTTSQTALPVATSASLAQTSAQTTAQTSVLPSTSSSSSPQSSGLSSGAAAGIGVGVAVAVIALISLAVFFWWRRRRARERPQAPEELDGRQVPPMSAMSAPMPPQELDTSNTRQELEGSYAPAKNVRGNGENISAYERSRAQGWRPKTIGPPSELPT
ncbi:MAG: hypothetical protein Q9165_001450 [Trypethelium subeluteriae]